MNRTFLLGMLAAVGFGTAAAFIWRPDTKPKDAVRLPPRDPDLVNSLGMKFMQIPAGTFVMGSPLEHRSALNDYSDEEGPQHEVEITRAFYLGAYEVTQGQYEKVMGENPS